MDGWVDGASNVIGIQGAVFSYADNASSVGMTSNFTGTNACIAGSAAKVDLMCTPVAPATDCYATFWGAAISFNLNQPIDPVTGLPVGSRVPYDASALSGFAFEISGNLVPTSIRFRVDTANGEYCSPPTQPITIGANAVLFSDLRTECWTVGGEPGETAKSALLKITWQVVTNSNAQVPFDFCVSNIRALLL